MLLVTVVAGGVVAWRRWRGPWPITPQPEWPTFEPVAPADPPTPAPDWVEPADGTCPEGYPVKANRTGIYHLPGGRFYDRTTPARCYTTPEAAERDGYRRSKL